MSDNEIQAETTFPWEHQPGEPMLWFVRFERFRQMGTTRAMAALYAEDRAAREVEGSGSTPGSWTEAARKWRWRERAAAWDRHELARKQAEYERERQEDREIRTRSLKSFRAKVLKALNEFDPAHCSLGELTGALRMATEQLRIEYDDQPAQRHEVVGRVAVQSEWNELRHVILTALEPYPEARTAVAERLNPHDATTTD